MKLTIGEAREFVRARLDELASQASDMLLDTIDDRNLDTTIDSLLEDAITYIHLAAPASLMEGPIITESSFAAGDLAVTDRVLDIDTALADTDDDILRLISFQCGDSAIKLTNAYYEDTPEARMQLNQYIQGQPDSPALVRLDDSPNYKPHYKYYTTDMCLDGLGQALRFVLRYFARPKLQGNTLSVSPSALTLGAGINTKSFTLSSTSSWNVTSTLPDWVQISDTNGVAGTAIISVSVLQNRGSERACSIGFANADSTATLEVTQREYSNSEGNERLRVASPAMTNGVIRLPSTEIANTITVRVAAEGGLAWEASLSDTDHFFISPSTGIGTGIDNWSSVVLKATSVNDTQVARTATLTFSATGVNPIVISLRQPAQLTVTPRLTGVDAAQGSVNFDIATESTWSIELLGTAGTSNRPEGFYVSSYSGSGNATISAFYPANNTGEVRLMGFNVTGGGATVQVVISQAAAAQVSIGVSPALLGDFPASGDTSGMTHIATVSTSSGAAWTLDTTTVPSWATIRRLTGDDQNKISVTALEPNTGERRTQSISVYLQSDNTRTASFTIAQAAAAKSITILDSEVPTDSVTVPYSGGTFTATLTATGAWQISGNKSWLHITSSTSGNSGGTSTITFTVDSGTDADDAAITGQLTGLPAGSDPVTCSYYIIREAAPVVSNYIVLGQHQDNWLVNDMDVPNTGESGLAVSLRASGAWTASTPNTWIHPMTQYGDWSGNATQSTALWLEVDNNSGASRTGTIVASLTGTSMTATFTIYQAGDGTVTLDASFNRSNIESTGGRIYLRVVTQTGIVWNINNVSSGLTPDSYSGSGSTSSSGLGVTVDSTSSARDLSLRVYNTSYSLSKTVTIHQEAPASQATSLIITPNGRKDIPASQTSQNITVTAVNVSWTASCNDENVNLSPSSGSNSATIAATFNANTDASNTRPMRITVSGGGISRELYLVQAAATDPLIVSPQTVTIPGTGGSQQVNVTTVGTWSITKSHDWILTSINAGTSTQAESFDISATANSGGSRSGSVVVSGGGTSKTVTVTQASGAALFVEPTTVSLLRPANSTGQTYVFANDAWEVDEETSNIPVWLNYSYTTHAGSQNGEALNFVAISQNDENGSRSGTIKVKLVNVPDADPITITVTQSAGSRLSIYPTTLNNVNSRGYNGSITVTSNCNWSIIQVSTDGIAIDEEDLSGTGDDAVPFYVKGNPYPEARQLSIVFQTEDGSVTTQLTINQDAGELRTSVSTLSQFPASGTEDKTVTLYSSAMWDVASQPSWISLIRPTNGSPNTPDGILVTIRASENTSSTSTRSGQIVFRQTQYGNTTTLNVSQARAGVHTLTISPSEDVHLANGDATTQALTITSDTEWTIDLSESFGITASSTTGTGNADVTLNIPVNTGNGLRRCKVTVKSTDNAVARTLYIWQPLNNDSISIDPDETIIFDEDHSTGQVTVYANRDWTAAASETWLQFSPSSGSANQAVTVTFNPRISITKPQYATFTVTSAGGATASIACRTMPPVIQIEPINQ